MPKLSATTIDLDESTFAYVERAAKAHGQTREEWITKVIRENVDHDRSAHIRALAGCYPDFPLRDDAGTNS
jgi:hypothetical protein